MRCACRDGGGALRTGGADERAGVANGLLVLDGLMRLQWLGMRAGLRACLACGRAYFEFSVDRYGPCFCTCSGAGRFA